MILTRKKFFTKAETVKYLERLYGIKMSERTLDRRRNEGKLKYSKDKSSGRVYFKRSDLDEFVTNSLKEEVNIEKKAEEILSGK